MNKTYRSDMSIIKGCDVKEDMHFIVSKNQLVKIPTQLLGINRFFVLYEKFGMITIYALI